MKLFMALFIKRNFPGIYDYYKIYEWDTPNGTPASDAQHEMMAAHYIDTLSDLIESFDNGKHSKQIYDDFAWIGLRNNNVTYEGLSHNEKKETAYQLIDTNGNTTTRQLRQRSWHSGTLSTKY
ncbi:hypothetical protein [Carboxylicivirga sp. RSCT41]|uniref:hypothetical protein n=1 Tax=Carboxylicivirga agarovorans TaxID=3417570 RepID=UPI003D34E34E